MGTKDIKPTIIIVLGMHRSGTSAVTNLIASLGFNTGCNLMEADEDNPKGYWEDNDIYNLNNELLSHLYTSWDQVDELKNRRLIIFLDYLLLEFKEKAKEIIQQRINQSTKIVVKDPRFNILLPFWEKIFEEMNLKRFYILVVRNPISVSKSLFKRNGINKEKSLKLWYYYNISIFNDLSDSICITHFEQLSLNPEKEIHKICQFLNLNNETCFLEPNKTMWSEIFDSNLIHYALSPKEAYDQTLLESTLSDFYEFLQTNSDTPFIISEKKIYFNQNFAFTSPLFEKENEKLVSSVFCKKQNVGQPVFFSKKEHYSGLQTITFANRTENNSNEICIFLCDKPCFIRVDEIKIITSEKEIIITELDGNYIFESHRNYIFDTNIPYIKFILLKSEDIKEIVLSVYIETDRLTVSSFIISYYKLSGIEKNHFQNQLNVKDNSVKEVTKLNEIYSIEIKNLNEQITKLKRPKTKEKHSNIYKIKSIPKLSVLFDNMFEHLSIIKKLILPTNIKNSYKNESDTENSYINKIFENEITDEIKLYIQNYPVLYFEIFEKPLVSIIIPVFNQWFYTYHCLKSILLNTKGIKYEIIIADDASTDFTKNLLWIVKNITHLRNKTSLLFLKNCNNAAKYAKGKYIHFLNNDVKVHENWLVALINTIELDEKIGLVGSKLQYPNGKLQEAGGIIWRDASGCNYGHLQDPGNPEYNYLKESDYISGASILVRKNLWKQLNGFDNEYSPAYYEDTDLSFRIRKAGFKVIYQPLSVITHYEGMSHGRDITDGIKKSQVINQKKFFNKWKDELNTNHLGNSQRIFLARDRSKNKKQVLVLDRYVPNYDKDAGSRSTFSYIKLLVEMGFNVKFYGDYSTKLEPYTTTLLQLGVEVLYSDYYQYNFHQWIANNGIFLDYVILNRMHIAVNHLNLIIEHTNAKIAYVGHDLHFIDSRKKFERTGYSQHYEDSLRFFEIENNLFNNVDCIFPFSTFEAPFIKEMVPHKIVQPIPVFFFDNIPSNINIYENRKDIFFIGGFDHRPNVDSIIWFVKEVFPNIQKQIQDIKLYILGSNPNDEVKRLASKSIIVTGYISDEELKEYYSNCKISVLPLQYGAGVKGKLLEALFYQIPTVITSVAAEGVPEIEKYSLIADKPVDFANRILDLYNNPHLWSKKSKKSRKLILKYYTKENAKRLLSKTLFDIT